MIVHPSEYDSHIFLCPFTEQVYLLKTVRNRIPYFTHTNVYFPESALYNGTTTNRQTLHNRKESHYEKTKRIMETLQLHGQAALTSP